jgi:hypothetical protein
MPPAIQGTKTDLNRIRRRYWLMRETVGVLDCIGKPLWAEQLGREADAIAHVVFMVEVKCVSCRQMKYSPVTVGDPDRTVPRACVCEDCDAQAMQAAS